MANSVAIGIDLGTTNSCVAVFRHDVTETIVNEQGHPTTPSYVAFTKNGRLIGEGAKSQLAIDPKTVVYCAKRLIGRQFDDESLQKDVQHLPFKVINDNGKPKIEVKHYTDGQEELKQFSPEEISGMVLCKMKQIAADFLDSEVTDAVITVPAYFNDSQRQATKDAGEIAGLNVLRIINEPTAAAIAYGLVEKNNDQRTVLVFDMGGGTLDVSILEIADGLVKVKSTYGDTNLGGEDFDTRLVEHFANEFKQKFNLDPMKDSQSISKLRANCETIKKRLSVETCVTLEMDCLMNGINFLTSISQAKFEQICLDLFKSILVPVQSALDIAKLDKSDIDDIVLVGGSSRIPKIRRMLSEFFNGKHLNDISINPDEAIARGAAIQAAILNQVQSSVTEDLLLIDVVTHSIGVEILGGKMVHLIPRTTIKPAVNSKMFSTLVDNQSIAEIKIFEGEHELTKENRLLGSFKLTNLPPMPSRFPQIEIIFEVDQNGILNVTANEKNSGTQSQITIDRNGLTNLEIDRAAKQTKLYEEQDKARRVLEIAKSQLNNCVNQFANEVNNQQIRDLLSAQDKTRLDQIIRETKEWSKQSKQFTAQEIDQKREYLTNVCNSILAKAFGCEEDNYEITLEEIE